MKYTLFPAVLIILTVSCSPVAEQKQEIIDPVEISLEYQSWEDTPKPEGDPVKLGLATYAKVLCTAVFESGRDPDEAFQNSGKIFVDQDLVEKAAYEIDFENKQAIVFLGDSIRGTSTYSGDQGCIIDSPEGLQFEPVKVTSTLPPAEETPWPMGDIIESAGNYDQQLLDEAAELAFEEKSLTAALLVVHHGNIVLEKYGNGAHKDMQLESWSMGKSLTATLIGRLMQNGKLTLDQKAPVEEWQGEGDPRGEITIRNLLNMSGGLRFPSHRGSRSKCSVAFVSAYVYLYFTH